MKKQYGYLKWELSKARKLYEIIPYAGADWIVIMPIKDAKLNSLVGFPNNPQEVIDYCGGKKFISKKHVYAPLSGDLVIETTLVYDLEELVKELDNEVNGYPSGCVVGGLSNVNQPKKKKSIFGFKD